MKVLVVHNQYRTTQPSGENVVVDQEVEWLRASGVEVATWTTRSDWLYRPYRRFVYRPALLWSPLVGTFFGIDFLFGLCRHRPDVVHLHNVYPLMSPAVILLCKLTRVPVISTVHNYRRECIKGSFFRDGAMCTRCAGKKLPIDGLINRCYRDNWLQSALMMISLALHRKTWRLVDKHVVLTEFQRRWLIGQGIRADAISVRPTSCPDRTYSLPSPGRVLFAGRLDVEKGFDILLKAWQTSLLRHAGWHLDIAGDGPLRKEAVNCSLQNEEVHYHGILSSSAVQRLLVSSSALAAPSRFLEGYPRIVSEAFASARPVVAISNPNMDGVVGEAGWLAAYTDDYASALDQLLDGKSVELKALKARAVYDEELRDSVSIRHLLQIYEEAT